MFTDPREALAYIRKEKIAQIDVKVCDLQGRWRRMTYEAANVGERLFAEGTGISLSPYPGYRSVEQGDMTVRPDVGTGFVDPFHARPTLAFLCDIYLPDGSRYPRDPRHVLQRAEQHLADLELGAHALFSPEYEFYVLDQASFHCADQAGSWAFESHGLGWGESPRALYPIGLVKLGQIDQPLDRSCALREAMVAKLEEAGIKVKYHHHELGSPGQVEIEVLFTEPVRTADEMMIARYIIHNTAIAHGKVATFMPKPFSSHAGNGVHYHQYLTDGQRSLFYDPQGYAGLSRMALSYLAGQLEHTPALMGLGNASTNSYRRFAPNLAAPVKLFFAKSNRSSALRIPAYAINERECRTEYRMPDATANPYLIIAAQLMAGLEGVREKKDPSAMGFGPYDVNVYALPPEEQAKLKDIPLSFEAALSALDRDRGFLKHAGVFSDELIDAWIDMKRVSEIAVVHGHPHPVEFDLYFDL
ncbi:MAG: glutamine synthetase [Deltaproteobacteria bacterium]|nr:glutamine synthetase [Deltaproteobacteria bacterium]